MMGVTGMKGLRPQPVASSRPPDAALVAALRGCLRRRGISLALSGVDGSGKTFLARALRGTLAPASIPIRIEHRFRWSDNLLAIPALILWNRFFGRRLLVFNRCWVDNLAKLFPVTPRGHRWLRRVARCWAALSPAFDRVLLLEVSYDEVRRRGRRLDREEYARLERNYAVLTAEARLYPVDSNGEVLTTVLSDLGCLTAAGGQRSTA